MTESRPPYGDTDPPKDGMVGIRFEGEDMILIDQLRGEETRAGYCRRIVREGLAAELERMADSLRGGHAGAQRLAPSP